MRRRRVLWLAAAVALLLGATFLLSSVEDAPIPTRREALRFPRGMREHEWKRREARATLVVPPAEGAPEGAPVRRRDPFLVALPGGPDVPLVVLEANALRHSRLGELFVQCVLAREPRAFENMKRESGIDVLQDVDRVGFAGDAVVVSGFFDAARWERLESDPTVRVSAYGDGGRLFTTADGPVIGTWGTGLIVFGDDERSVRQAIDQVEGRAPAPELAIPDDLAYGEVYGILPGDAARRLVGDDALAERLASLASRIELHVDAMDDVAAVVRVRGDDAQGLSDLSRSLGAALTAARLRANALSDRRMAELLDFAKVVPGDGRFSVELALPADRLEAWFADCRPPGRASANGDAAGAATGAGSATEGTSAPDAAN